MILYWYHQALEVDGLLPSLFYSEETVTPEGLCKIAIDKTNLFMLVYDNHSSLPVGHIHANSFDGLTCMGHFSFLRKIHGKQCVAVGRESLRQFFAWRAADSELPVATSMMGLTPVTNRLACRFVERIGFKPIYEIPDACYLRKTDEYVPGMLSIIFPHQLGS